MGMKHREWILDDGSVWTTTMVRELVGCTASSAYNRLTKSADPKRVLRPLDAVKKINGKKVYILDDGSGWTSDMVVEHTGCLKSTASTRLSCYTDPDKVLAPPLKKTQREMEARKAMQDRMYFDRLGHWALINKYS